MGGTLGATAVGVVSASNRFPAHPVNMKANNRTMIRISAIPFCQVSKQRIRRERNASSELATGGTGSKAVSVSASTKLKKPQAFLDLRPPGKN
jgi:hypothetical protein